MKLAEHNNSLLTNTETKSQGFGIGDCAVIIDILRNRLYEKKIQTTSQEYISNGRDACREAGKPDNSMEITIPTHLSPTFRVRDFGVGITPERMMDVFIKYGSSTKRSDNVQTGGLGIGGKSWFSYGDSFSINTYLDGIRRAYIAHIGSSNAGHLDLISTEKTKEENGTEIIGAVKSIDVEEFRDAVLRAIYFWEQKPVLKGHIDMPVLVPGYKVGNTLEIINGNLLPGYIDGGYSSEPLAVIDGIPYVISEKLLNKCKTLQKLQRFARQKLVLKFGNGVVEVAASRESIADSPKSVDALEKIAQKVSLEVKTNIADRFGSVASTSEYLKTYRELNSIFHVESGFAKYNGYSITNDNIVSDTLKKVKITEIHCLGRYGRGKVDKITRRERTDPKFREIPIEWLDHVFFSNGGESKVSMNKRIRAYFEKNTKMFLIEKENLVQPETGVNLDKVVNDLGIKDFQTITYVVVPKAERVKISREKTEFCIHAMNGERYQYTTLADNTQKWFYVPVTDKGMDYETEELKDLSQYLKDSINVRICGLAERALKMVQGDANFSPLKNWLDKFKSSKKEIAYAKSLKAINKTYMPTLCVIKGIKDTELTDIIEEYKQIEKNSVTTMPSILLKKVNEEKEVKDFATRDESVAKLIKKQYSLMAEMESSYYASKHAQEMVYYLNAKFEQK